MAGPRIGGGGTGPNGPSYIKPDPRPTLEQMNAVWPDCYIMAVQFWRATHKASQRVKIREALKLRLISLPRPDDMIIEPGYFPGVAEDLIELARVEGVRMP